MVVIKIMGGFASQFNKYALGYSIAQYLNTELVLDLSDYSRGYFRPYSLCYLRLPNYKIITDHKIKKVMQGIIEICNSNDMRQMIRKPVKKDFWINREEEDYREFLDENPGFEICRESKALQFLIFKQSINSKFVHEFKKRVNAELSIAVHIRRGDYVSLGWNDDMKFYRAAIAKFIEENQNYHFYFFSNDLEWTKEYFGNYDKFHFVSALKGNLGDIEELFCMAHCKYRILSRFSGYGILANILASEQYHDSFALMNGSGSYNNTTQLSLEMMEIYQNVANGEIREPEKGGILYINSDCINLNELKYNSFVKSEKIDVQMNDLQVIEDNAWLDIEGINLPKHKNAKIQDLIQKRVELYEKNHEIENVRECFESINWYSNKNDKSIWEMIYSLSNIRTLNICIITTEIKNCWRIEGFYLLALILSRIGHNVDYRNWNKSIGSQMKEPYQASNLDGKKYPFMVYDGYNKKIKTRLNQDIVIIDSLHSLGYIDVGTATIYYIREAKKERQWLAHLISKCGINLLILPPLQKIEYSNDIKSPYDFFRLQEDRWKKPLNDILKTNGESNA